MNDSLIIGAGPAGLLAALAAHNAKRGDKVRVLATGIGTMHISPGWIGILNTDPHPALRAPLSLTGRGAGGEGNLSTALEHWIAEHPNHPYALTGLDALRAGVALLCDVCAKAGLKYVGDLSSNFQLPTALGAIKQAAIVPASFAAGDIREPGAMLIAAPRGWRDFYPALCAENLARYGTEARGITFDLPQVHASSEFDMTPVGLARLFDQADVRERVAAQIKPQLDGAARVGLPAILGLEHSAEAWRDLQERLGVPVFEIPTLPPSAPGIRLYNTLKQSLTRAGVQILLDMTASHGIVQDGKAAGVAVQNVVREKVYRAGHVILATGGLYGGGIVTDHTGMMREAIFGLPLHTPGELGNWFDDTFLSKREHPIHYAGVRANEHLQPLDENGRVALEGVTIAGRLLAHYNPLAEGSTEGVILATAYRAANDR